MAVISRQEKKDLQVNLFNYYWRRFDCSSGGRVRSLCNQVTFVCEDTRPLLFGVPARGFRVVLGSFAHSWGERLVKINMPYTWHGNYWLIGQIGGANVWRTRSGYASVLDLKNLVLIAEEALFYRIYVYTRTAFLCTPTVMALFDPFRSFNCLRKLQVVISSVPITVKGRESPVRTLSMKNTRYIHDAFIKIPNVWGKHMFNGHFRYLTWR